MSDLVKKAIEQNRCLYAATATDEDGYSETVRFNTFKEAFDYAENMFELGAINVTFGILSVGDLKKELVNV